MPNFAFAPIIGGGFDQVAQQQQHWAGFNAAQDAANIQRQNAAEQNANNWLQNVAQMRAAAEARAASAQQQAEANQQSQESMAYQRQQDIANTDEKRRQFDVGADLSKQEIAAKEKQYAFNRDEQNRLERQQLDEIKNQASAIAPDARVAGTALESARRSEQDAADKFGTAISDSDPKLAPGAYTFDKLTKEWKAIDQKPETIKAVESANAKLSNARTEHETAKMAHVNASEDWKRVVADASKYNLHISPTDYRVYSAKHDQWFGETPKTKAEPIEQDQQDSPGFTGFHIGEGGVQEEVQTANPTPFQPNYFTSALRFAAGGIPLAARGGAADAATTVSGMPTAPKIPLVTTKDQYELLPSGSVYTESDGKTYRKP